MMARTLLIASLFFPLIVSIQLGCFQNATLSNQPNGFWLSNISDCDLCACRTILLDAVAFNCFVSSNTNKQCFIIHNYTNSHGGVQIIPNHNGSYGCFFQVPPIPDPETTERPTTVVPMTTTPALCSSNTLSTVLLRLVNAPNQSYINYTFVYRPVVARNRLMFCFLNRQHFWALDDVSIRHTSTGTQLILNGGFDTGGWTPWITFNTIYYGTGIRQNAAGTLPRSGSYFYYDEQYSIPDGIYQNITMIPGDNYTITFFLANPRGGNFSLAVVSIGP